MKRNMTMISVSALPITGSARTISWSIHSFVTAAGTALQAEFQYRTAFHYVRLRRFGLIRESERKTPENPEKNNVLTRMKDTSTKFHGFRKEVRIWTLNLTEYGR